MNKIMTAIGSLCFSLCVFYIFSWVSLFNIYGAVKKGQIDNIKYGIDWEHLRKHSLDIQPVTDELPDFGSGMVLEAESNILTPEHCSDALSGLTDSKSSIYPHDMRILSYDLVELHLKQDDSLISIIMHFEKWHWRLKEIVIKKIA